MSDTTTQSKYFMSVLNIRQFMKKIVYSFCALCAMSALTVGYTSIASNANAKSATTLANIEALSSDSESSSDSGTPKCTGPKVKVYS